MKADCFSYTNALKHYAMMQLIICSSLFQEASLHDFGIRGHVFFVSGQNKIKFCMGSNHAICTKFLGWSHDALNFAESIYVVEINYFSVYAIQVLNSSDWKRYIYKNNYFFKMYIFITELWSFFRYSEILSSCRLVGEPMQNQIQKLHICSFLTMSSFLSNNVMESHPNVIPQRKITKQSWNCLPFLLFRLSFFVLIKNEMEHIQFDIVKFLSSLSHEQKKESCLEKSDFHFPANQEISCNLFTVLLDIAANFATNRNETIQNMLTQEKFSSEPFLPPQRKIIVSRDGVRNFNKHERHKIDKIKK